MTDLKHRDVYAANDVEKIVKRGAKWFTETLVEGVKATMRDGRPLYTDKIPEDERLAALLTAPKQFWEVIQTQDPETAMALAASVVKAREKGDIPEEGPRADEVTAEDAAGLLEKQAAPAPDAEPGAQGSGTERARPLPSFISQIPPSLMG